MARKPAPKRPENAQPEEAPAPPAPARPTSLDALIGQDRAVETLRAAVAAGRIHHAWAFGGPVGVGKFTAALAFAAELLTPKAGPDRDRVTALLAAATHPDLHVITKELSRVSRDADTRTRLQTNIPIEVVREFLIEPASRTSAAQADSAASKVFIVDEAEMLDGAGQDALLKTLEEPAPGTVIILVTSSEHELSPTIRSRSQRVAFTPLDEEPFSRWLTGSGLLAGLSKDDEAFVRRFAAGSPGVAAVAVRTGLVEWWRTVGPALQSLDSGRFPVAIGQQLADLANAWAKARAAENKRASKEAANHAAARWMFRVIGDHYRLRLRDAARSGHDPRRALAALDAIDRAELHADRNVQLPFVMENLAAQLASPT